MAPAELDLWRYVWNSDGCDLKVNAMECNKNLSIDSWELRALPSR